MPACKLRWSAAGDVLSTWLVMTCRREVERRTHPLVRSDFELLSSELEAWRQQQTAAIKATGLDPAEEQVRLAWRLHADC